MSTAIQFALMEVRATIPNEILTLAFKPLNRYRTAHTKAMTTTIDHEVMTKVIDARIRPYIDALGAQEVEIPLSGLQIRQEDVQAWSCHIPKSLTAGRRITSVLGIAVGYYGHSQHGAPVGPPGIVSSTTSQNMNCGVDVYLRGARTILDAHRPANLTATTNVYLIDENTIYCEDRIPLGNMVLRCKVASDEIFSFIQGGNMMMFAKLVVLATKAYIYNTLSVPIEQGQLEGGVEIGVIKETVDRYSDAQEQFEEFYREKWQKIQRMADKPRRTRYLNMLVG